MLPFLRDPLRGKGSQRTLSFVLAVLAEAALILVVLSLGWVSPHEAPKPVSLVSMAIRASSEASPSPQSKAAKAVKSQTTPREAEPQEQPSTPALPEPARPIAPPLVIMPMPRDQMAQFDISRLPRQSRPAAPSKGQMGPVDQGVPGDSKLVGLTPGGQPMYAASWYREPYDEELRGYLSLASGPGWALITCRTVPDFKVDDCVGLDEYPSGSQIQRAVLAAAWQFKVRPPRVGGVNRVGDWVRIRIDYTERRR